jgi:hypothetical protein
MEKKSANNAKAIQICCTHNGYSRLQLVASDISCVMDPDLIGSADPDQDWDPDYIRILIGLG